MTADHEICSGLIVKNFHRPLRSECIQTRFFYRSCLNAGCSALCHSRVWTEVSRTRPVCRVHGFDLGLTLYYCLAAGKLSSNCQVEAESESIEGSHPPASPGLCTCAAPCALLHMYMASSRTCTRFDVSIPSIQLTLWLLQCQGSWHLGNARMDTMGPCCTVGRECESGGNASA